MRFAFATLLALATTAAAGVIARDETNVGVTIAVASPEQLTSCKCLKDNFGDTGVHISQDLTSYQCAYPNGACTWSKVSY